MTGARLGAYWTKRSVGIEAEARRLVELLAALSEVAPQLGRWVFYDAAERTAPCTLESVAEALRTRTLEETHAEHGLVRGHQVVCRARGRFDDDAELRATIIAEHAGSKDAWVPSRILIELRRELPIGGVRRLLDVLVLSTDPAWAFADCGGGALRPDPTGAPRVGWATYLHRSYGRPRTPIAGVEVVPRGAGRMIQPIHERPDDLATLSTYAQETERALAHDGVLRSYAAAVHEPGDFEPGELAAAAPKVAERPAAPTASPVVASAVAPREVRHTFPVTPQPPARVEPVENDPILETQAVRPVAPGPTLPFVRGQAAGVPPPDATRATPVPSREPGINPLGETSAVEMRSPFASQAAALPFAAPAAAAAKVEPASVASPLLTLEQYASLCAWLAASPQDRASVLTRHHVASEAALAALEADYRALFARDPALHGRFGGLVMRYREAFARFPRDHGSGSGT